METLASVSVSVDAGVEGDFRGSLKGGRSKRQISLIDAEGWAAAMAELDHDAPWWTRRANLLVQGLRLPREPGTVICIGDGCRIEVTMECDPCWRMDEIVAGLRAALAPDWRGGVLGKVIAPGDIRLGDKIRVER